MLERLPPMKNLYLIVALTCLALSPSVPASAAPGEAASTPPLSAEAIRRATGIEAGLAVHVGCGGGDVAMQLAGDGRMLVQGLTLDKAAVDGLRERAAETGLGGLVTFDARADYASLPYNDNLVTLLIADLDALAIKAPARDEIMRVLSPFGVAYLRTSGTWQTIRKALPETMGEWTHHDHLPDGNAQSPDELVGPPKGLQWFISSGGRAVSELRLGTGVWVQSGRLSDPEDRKVYLDGRNAFNGLLLWRRTEPRGISRGSMDSTFCIDGNTVYGILDDPNVAKAWDLTTGRELVSYDQGLTNGEGSQEWQFRKTPLSLQHMILDGVLIQASGSGAPDVAALDPDSGNRLWDWTAPEGMDVALSAASRGRVYLGLTKLEGFVGYHYGNKLAELASLVALDLKTGKVLWTSDDVKGFHSFNIVAAEGAVFLASNRIAEGKKSKSDEGPYSHLIRIDAATGRTMFDVGIPKLGVPAESSWNYKLRYKDGMLLPAFGGAVVAFDAKTGEVAGRPYEMPTKTYQDPPMFCSTIRGTENGFLTGKFTRFVDLRDKSYSAISIARSGCDDGSYPAYGLIYAGDDDCGCTSWLRGKASLHARDYSSMRVPDDRRLVKGPAYGKAPSAPVTKEDWPMLMGANDRMSYSPTKLPAQVKEVARLDIPVGIPEGPITADWKLQNDICGVVTPPIVVGDTVYAAATHQHRLYALDASTGAVRWSFTAAGRIDSPPTLHDGLCVFGSRDGWVYALRVSDGELAWRFLAAPDERQIVNSGQLENASPLFGSVLVHGGKLFVNAGRHNQADGGITLWRLDPRTGTPEASATIAGQNNSNESGDQPARYDGQGRLNDILTTTAKGQYLVLNIFAINPKSLNWSSINRSQDGGPVPDIDHADASIMAFAFNNAVGTIDRRSDSIGAKGGGGFLYGTRDRKTAVTAPRIVRAGRMLFAAKSKGELMKIDLDADGMLMGGGDKKAPGTQIAKLPTRGTMWAMATTDDTVCVARGSDLSLVGHDGTPRQRVQLPAQPVAYGLAIARGRLYVALDDGTIRVFAAE